MARKVNKLSVLKIRGDMEPGLYGDGGGLYLQVSNTRTKAWVFRYMIAGRARKMGLGDFERLPLADARKKALDAYKLILDGKDPIDTRNITKAAQRKTKTFKECATTYIADHEGSWKNEKHRKQWPATLKEYVYPVIGNLPVSAIEMQHVLKIIKPIWQTKTETANRVRNRIELVLDWATAHGFRTGDNPARWKGFIDQVLPAKAAVRPVKHHAALPYADLPGFMAKLRGKDSISARALELTILTAMRTDATIGAAASEFDLDKALWTIPAARLKGKKNTKRRDLVIPLPDRAVAILKDLPNEGPFMFPGGVSGKGLSNMAMAQLLKGMGYAGDAATVHGFRSTFKDWATEQTDYATDLVEYAYAHLVKGQVEAAYRRGDMFDKRRRLMLDWAAYCGGAS